jgi:hypothetical protein
MVQSEPQLSSAQLVERWRERPEHERLGELATVPLPELETEAVARELEAAIGRLLAEAGPERRLDELIARAEGAALNEDEKRELTALQTRKRPPKR